MKTLRIAVGLGVIAFTIFIFLWGVKLRLVLAQSEADSPRSGPGTYYKVLPNNQPAQWSAGDAINRVIFSVDAKGNWDFSPEFWRHIESHCVAVLTEKHTVHHKRTISAGEIPDDRMEW